MVAERLSKRCFEVSFPGVQSMMAVLDGCVERGIIANTPVGPPHEPAEGHATR
jgi:hypothetical protein